MTCLEAQQQISFYLYGELDFTLEEELEQHLDQCEPCRAVLEKERVWHEALKAEETEISAELLSKCRQELHESLEVVSEQQQPFWIRCLDSLGLQPNAWTMRLATASVLVFLGFGLSRLAERQGFLSPSIADSRLASMDLLNSGQAHVRMIEPGGGDQVQLVLDEVREHVITGSRNDPAIRRAMLVAFRRSADPAVRVDSVELLRGDGSAEVKQALLESLRTDPNAGVRLKAIEALGMFVGDSTVRRTLAEVLVGDESPDVRAEAIDLLVPPAAPDLTPQIAASLEEVMRSDPDDYIRMRCQQALQLIHAPIHIY